MAQNAPCKFCGKSAKLLKRSHVIPRFMYEGMYDNNQMTVYEFAKPDKPKFVQTGYFDKYAYCSKCENELWSKLERYAATLFCKDFDQIEPIVSKLSDNHPFERILFQDIDYVKLKLFFLTILWRADQSQNPFFKQVNIPAYRDQIREMILKNDPGPDTLFRVSVFAILNKNGERVKLINQPANKKNEHLDIAIFVINGFVVAIDLHPENSFQFSKDFYLKSTGELEMALLKGMWTYNFLIAFGIPHDIATFYAYL